jgi:hypothetical protein
MAPAGTSFDDVLKQEYECLKRSTERTRAMNDAWIKPKMYVTPRDPRCLYRERPCEIRPQVHIGQLKLFLSELQFLTEFVDMTNAATVVYAGAADGRHIAYLAQLMSNLNFRLYDPRPFSSELDNIQNVLLYTGDSGMFTTTKASGFHPSNHPHLPRHKIYLISDIRTGNHADPTCDFDACCGIDMTMQLDWMRAMRPAAAMFKFRLSYKPGKTAWLAPHSEKHLKYGIFAAHSATEMRLVCTDADALTTYDNTEMEERAYYFNNFTRLGQYGPKFASPGLKQHPIKEALGMDDCFDCFAMREVCLSFLTKKHEGVYCVHVSEVVEVTTLAIRDTISIPSDIANIVARYACVVNEDDLYGFISAVVRNCGSNASYKMHAKAHCDHTPTDARSASSMVQWIDRMDRLRGAPLVIKKTKKKLPIGVVDEIYKLYAPLGKLAPPLGEYPL